MERSLLRRPEVALRWDLGHKKSRQCWERPGGHRGDHRGRPEAGVACGLRNTRPRSFAYQRGSGPSGRDPSGL